MSHEENYCNSCRYRDTCGKPERMTVHVCADYGPMCPVCGEPLKVEGGTIMGNDRMNAYYCDQCRKTHLVVRIAGMSIPRGPILRR